MIRAESQEHDAMHAEPPRHADCTIVAGIPYSAKQHATRIKDAVNGRFSPAFFGLMYQARATLDCENMSDGIVCHIGHGTTEIMAVAHGNIAHAQTVLHGVGDIVQTISASKTAYLDHDIFSKNNTQMAEPRRVLAAHISDALEKVVIDHPHLDVVCAGGGALIPRLVPEIKNDIITRIRTAGDPIYSNALGMLRKAMAKKGRADAPAD